MKIKLDDRKWYMSAFENGKIFLFSLFSNYEEVFLTRDYRYVTENIVM